MSAHPKGNVFIVAGISGSGKGTVCNKLIERHGENGMVRPISVTTRTPREGEKFAGHYYFVGKEIFEWLIETEQLLEHTKVWMDHYYGSLQLSVDEAMARGENVLFEVNIEGIDRIKEKIPDAKVVFIQAPSEAEQRIRLELRGTIGAEQDERVKGAATELAAAKERGLRIITNDDLGRALEEIEQVFGISK